MRIITFSSFTEHSSPLFEDLNVIKLYDIITLQLIVFVFKFHCKLLPLVFDTFLILLGTYTGGIMIILTFELKIYDICWDTYYSLN